MSLATKGILNNNKKKVAGNLFALERKFNNVKDQKFAVNVVKTHV